MSEAAGDAISILVIGKTTGHSSLLVEALRETHAVRSPGYRLLVHQANTLDELRQQAPKVRIDFIAVALDTSETTCLEWLSIILSEIPLRLFLRRVVLINATGLQMHSLAVNVDALLATADDYQLDLMSANLTEPRQCSFLASRLMVYIEESLGCHSGIPELNTCRYDALANKA